jgi:hypothetical protein
MVISRWLKVGECSYFVLQESSDESDLPGQRCGRLPRLAPHHSSGANPTLQTF